MILDVYVQINVNEDHHFHNAEKNKDKKKYQRTSYEAINELNNVR
jgi:hypothetical protein